MNIRNSKTIMAELKELKAEVDKAMEAEDRDRALMLQGEVNRAERELEAQIEAEDAWRGSKPAPKPSGTLASLVLGERAGFAGVEVGFKNTVTVTALPGTVETDLEVPAKLESPVAGFARTLRWVPSDFDAIKFLRRGSQTGAVDAWGGVTSGESAEKETVIPSWSQVTANMETFAGYVPVSKQSLRSYSELEEVINHDLVLDVDETIDEAAVTGTNSSGMLGILNTTGIQVDETGYSGDYYTAIRHLKTLVTTNGRRVPDYVCVSPEISEALDSYKDGNDRFQTLGAPTLWGMTVVEDVNVEGILVYDSESAKIRYRDGVTVEVGYVDDQFAKNELSILAEREATLQVRYPSSFAYISKEDADAAPSAE